MEGRRAQLQFAHIRSASFVVSSLEELRLEFSERDISNAAKFPEMMSQVVCLYSCVLERQHATILELADLSSCESILLSD